MNVDTLNQMAGMPVKRLAAVVIAAGAFIAAPVSAQYDYYYDRNDRPGGVDGHDADPHFESSYTSYGFYDYSDEAEDWGYLPPEYEYYTTDYYADPLYPPVYRVEPMTTYAAPQNLIGYDLDGDGFTDAWYEVRPVDYQRLRQDQQRASAIMAQQHAQRLADQQRRTYVAPQPPNLAPGTEQYLTGRLIDVQRFALEGDRSPHVFGKLLLSDGIEVPVHFGLARDLDVELREGDTVSVVGHIGRMNERQIVLAQQVQTEYGMARLDRPNW